MTAPSSCIQLVLLHLMMVMGQASAKCIPSPERRKAVSSLIIKAKAKCRSLERYLQRTPVPPAAGGAWNNVTEFFDWHGRAPGCGSRSLEVYQ
jgi:hypothetical protein